MYRSYDFLQPERIKPIPKKCLNSFCILGSASGFGIALPMNTLFKFHQQLICSTARKCVPTEPFILHYWPITPLYHLRSFYRLPISHAALPVSAPGSCICFHLPLPEEVADGGVLRGQRAGQERHQALEALPQLLHVLLQGVDV